MALANIIKHKQFEIVKFNGYKREDVDKFMEELSTKSTKMDLNYSSLQKLYTALEEEKKELEKSLAEYKSKEALINCAIMRAESMKETIIKEAEELAGEKMIKADSEAKLSADKKMHEADEYAKKVTEEAEQKLQAAQEEYDFKFERIKELADEFVDSSNEKGKAIISQAQEEAKKLIDESNEKANEIINDANERIIILTQEYEDLKCALAKFKKDSKELISKVQSASDSITFPQDDFVNELIFRPKEVQVQDTPKDFEIDLDSDIFSSTLPKNSVETEDTPKEEDAASIVDSNDKYEPAPKVEESAAKRFFRELANDELFKDIPIGFFESEN